MTADRIPRTVGARIRQKRKEAGISAASLGRAAAALTGRSRPISASAVRNQENGTNGVPWELLRVYAEIFEVDLMWLANGDPPTLPAPEDVLEFRHISVTRGDALSGDWIPESEFSDDLYDDGPMLFEIPGFQDVDLMYGIVLDESMSPVYEKGSRLITCSYWDAPVFDGDHVVVHYSSDDIGDRKLAVRQIVLRDGRVQLLGIGSKHRPALELSEEEPGYVAVDSIVVASIKLHVPSRRPPIELEERRVSQTREHHEALRKHVRRGKKE